jgi:hypothetical protein
MNRSPYGSVKMGRIRGIRMLQRRGYVASVVGTVVGGIGLGWLGAYLGSEYGRRYMPDAGFLLFIVGYLSGYWIGTVSGAWAALRFRSYRARLATAALVGLLAPLPLAASFAVQSVTPGYSRLPSGIAVLLVLAGIGAAARAIALRSSPSGERSEKPPRAER